MAGLRRHRIAWVIVSAALLAGLLVGGVALRARAGQEEEIGLAAGFLGVQAKTLQLVPPALAAQASPGKARGFTVLYTSEAPGSKPERVEFVPSEGMEYVAEAYWVDELNALPSPGTPLSEADVQAKAKQFLLAHNLLPGTTVRPARTLPLPKDTKVWYMTEWELLTGEKQALQAKALVSVRATTGLVGMYRYFSLDTSQFGRVTVSREGAVANSSALLKERLPADAHVVLDIAVLSDRSPWTKPGRPVWQIGMIAYYPPGSLREPVPCAFVVDAISGRVVHNGALDQPLR